LRSEITQAALALLASMVLAQGVASPSIRDSTGHISIKDLRAPRYTEGLIENAAFEPSDKATGALESFAGSLHLMETEMRTSPGKLESQRVLGKETALFPDVDIAFFTVSGDLVPATQEVIRSGSLDRGRSFWDVIVQPGRVWAEPGEEGWSRAAFPFALVNSLEGETHNGVAMFAYRGKQVSNLRFQIVQQTAPFYVSDYFTATGISRASWNHVPIPQSEMLRQLYQKSVANELRIGTWSELAAQVGADRLANFDQTMGRQDSVLAGLDYRGKFYLKSCTSAAGTLPWCERARFGVWSATKALANETALLRLAQKFGPEVFDLKIADLVQEAAAYPAWREVRFEDAINMATGVGNGSTQANPNNISDGYLDPTYNSWYEARSESAKIHELLTSARPYPWGPGKVARYRDQDMFVLGVAMDRYLKSREGPRASLWSMLETEVFQPIGVYYAPTNRTIEADGVPGQPMMAFGYYPTIEDLVKIARLYQSAGRHEGAQILYSPRIEVLLHANAPVGFPTGTHNRFGERYYYNAFWMNAYGTGNTCRMLYPVMEGWGGNLVALLPHGITAIRLAKAKQDDRDSSDPSEMAMVADRIEAFCP
jgi:hypothetical protein